MKKRILSAVVVLVLFAGVLAGCISGHGTQEAKLNIMDDNYRNYYEIFVGSFYDSDGDGMGDLKGVEEKLTSQIWDATESGSCRSCLPQPIINMIQRITKRWTRHMVRRMILKSWQVRVMKKVSG